MSSVTAVFLEAVEAMGAPDVLELGTLRWEKNRPTHHRSWVPSAGSYVMSDVTPGEDVDVVADAHDLKPFEDSSVDALIAVSVWEHLRHPWVAAAAVERVLKPGGVALIATHHAFPVHGYPSDFSRWTDVGLAALFEWVGLETLRCDLMYPCRIIPPREVTRWNKAAPAFLNVEGVWRKG